MRYNARLDCLITLYQEFSMYVKDKAAKKRGVRSTLYIHGRLRYYPRNNPMIFLATNVTKMLDHNNETSRDKS